MNIPPEEPISRPDSPSAFSLENRIPQPPLPSQQNKRLLWWCRFIVWISPAPAWAIIGSGIAWLGFNHVSIALGIAILCAFGIGYCDAFLTPAVSKKDGIPVLEEAMWHAFAFALLQLIVAPLTLLVLALFTFFASAFV